MTPKYDTTQQGKNEKKHTNIWSASTQFKWKENKMHMSNQQGNYSYKFDYTIQLNGGQQKTHSKKLWKQDLDAFLNIAVLNGTKECTAGILSSAFSMWTLPV